MPPNQEEKCSIPERVDVKKAIEIVQSLIPNAGRGLIAREDIKEGELIFSIPRPLIIVVSSAFRGDLNSSKSVSDCELCSNDRLPYSSIARSF